ncbi:hypothetical protein G7Y89_g14125 [Cudoniella acicularis]|uniref:Uncharacterized protein n=1 Tax=Cudoniella acicularis TaxID=354080 RepID=A0A8H4R800_9HELO|nr:hypothetical protein G7Y89_g14125 [Cudoniella acicularis]
MSVNPRTATAADPQARLADNSVTSKQLIQIYLVQIAQHDNFLKAVIITAPEDLLEKRAAQLDAVRGPLHGIPILVKDNVATSLELELPTTCDSLALVGSKPRKSAVVIERHSTLICLTLQSTTKSNGSRDIEYHVTTERYTRPPSLKSELFVENSAAQATAAVLHALVPIYHASKLRKDWDLRWNTGELVFLEKLPERKGICSKTYLQQVLEPVVFPLFEELRLEYIFKEGGSKVHKGKARLPRLQHGIRGFNCLTPFLYWPVVKNLPRILATLSVKADSHSGTQVKSLGDHEKLSFLQGDEFPRAPGRLALWSGEEALYEKPDPIYNKEEVAWMTVDGEDGSFKIYIASDGEWVGDENQWKYQVRQTDGKLYKDGNVMARLRTNHEDLLERGELTEAVLSPPLTGPTIPISTTIGKPTGVHAGGQVDPPKSEWPTTWIHRLLGGLNRVQNIFIFQPSHVMLPRKSTVRTLEECPEGYPRLAALLDSDENFMLYRRFGFLQARILLNKQDQLRELEKDLDRLDKLDSKKDSSILKSREKDDAGNGRRKKVLSEIEEKFKEYAQLLTAARDLTAFSRPSNRDYLSVKSYFNEEAPLCNVESYIYRREDIITLKPGRENAWLDAVVERVLQKFSCDSIRYLFCSPDLRAKANPKMTGIILYSRARVDFVVNLIITGTILALLIVPVYILWNLTREIQSSRTVAIIIAVLLVSTLIFSGVLSLFTRAKRHEVLASAAAYCAVLVVFIGNVGQIS